MIRQQEISAISHRSRSQEEASQEREDSLERLQSVLKPVAMHQASNQNRNAQPIKDKDRPSFNFRSKVPRKTYESEERKQKEFTGSADFND